MERNRRQFIRGRWLAGAALPSPEGGTEIASILVQARPDRLDQVAVSIADIPGAEVHQRDPRGKLVAVVEGGGSDPIGEVLTRISLLPDVITATLVFHAIDAGKGAAA